MGLVGGVVGWSQSGVALSLPAALHTAASRRRVGDNTEGGGRCGRIDELSQRNLTIAPTVDSGRSFGKRRC